MADALAEAEADGASDSGGSDSELGEPDGPSSALFESHEARQPQEPEEPQEVPEPLEFRASSSSQAQAQAQAAHTERSQAAHSKPVCQSQALHDKHNTQELSVVAATGSTRARDPHEDAGDGQRVQAALPSVPPVASTSSMQLQLQPGVHANASPSVPVDVTLGSGRGIVSGSRSGLARAPKLPGELLKHTMMARTDLGPLSTESSSTSDTRGCTQSSESKPPKAPVPKRTRSSAKHAAAAAASTSTHKTNKTVGFTVFQHSTKGGSSTSRTLRACSLSSSTTSSCTVAVAVQMGQMGAAGGASGGGRGGSKSRVGSEGRGREPVSDKAAGYLGRIEDREEEECDRDQEGAHVSLSGPDETGTEGGQTGPDKRAEVADVPTAGEEPDTSTSIIRPSRKRRQTRMPVAHPNATPDIFDSSYTLLDLSSLTPTRPLKRVHLIGMHAIDSTRYPLYPSPFLMNTVML